MNAVQDHIFAIQLSIKQLSQGKFWLYLVPALIVASVFYAISSFFELVLGNSGFMGEIFQWLTKMTYTFVILTLLSPVNCLLSEKVDNEITGARFNGGLVRIINDMFRSIAIVIISSLLYLVIFGTWSMISWILGLQSINPVMYFVLSSFFYGFAFYDYSYERYEMEIWATFRFGFSKFSHLLITGCMFNLIYLIPHVGLILAPFLLTIVSTTVFLKMNGKISNIPHNTGLSD